LRMRPRHSSRVYRCDDPSTAGRSLRRATHGGRQQEERLITLVRDDGQETRELLLSEEVDLAQAAPAFGGRSVGGRHTSDRITVM
jgi:hypothetical protein